MTNLDRPPVQRLRRPRWSDSRLILGVLLVLGSVIAGAKIIGAARQTTAVYAAARELVPGQSLSAEHLVPVQVNLGDAADKYLPVERGVPAASLVVRETRAGELLTATAVASASTVSLKPVMLPVEHESASVLVAGSIVDVWVNQKQPGVTPERYGVPNRLLAAAPVSRGPERAGTQVVGTKGTIGVQVMVPADAVGAVIAAIDQGAKVTLVPIPGSPQRAAG